MFRLMNEVDGGVNPMRSNLESHIIQDGLADMEACADTITTVSHYLLCRVSPWCDGELWGRIPRNMWRNCWSCLIDTAH